MKESLKDVAGAHTVLVHVNGVWSGRLCFWVRIDFSGTKFAHVLGAGARVARASEAELLVLLGLCFVEELLVAFEALGGRAAYERRDGAPLSWHQLCKVEEFFVFGLRGEKRVRGWG